VQRDVEPLGLTLKVFDCYRPQRAVDDFVRWGKDLQDQSTKAEYYPRVPKQELFRRGYIAERSGHSRASTVDVTLVVLDGRRARQVLTGPLADGGEVDMGTPFDLFDERSHTADTSLAPDVQRNRQWLRALMQRHGWRNLPEEWWHYTLEPEPYPQRYFDVPVHWGNAERASRASREPVQRRCSRCRVQAGSRTMPAAAVWWLASSIRMKAPVARSAL